SRHSYRVVASGAFCRILWITMFCCVFCVRRAMRPVVVIFSRGGYMWSGVTACLPCLRNWLLHIRRAISLVRNITITLLFGARHILTGAVKTAGGCMGFLA